MPERQSSLSTADLRTVFKAFGKAEILRLKKAARFFGWRCRTDGDELLGEAFERALTGRRKCKRGLDPLVFLVGAMKSIASEINKGRKEGPVQLGMAEPSSPVHDLLPDSPRDEASPEDALVLKENQDHAAGMVAKLEELFANDGEAQLILMGTMDDLSAEEIREIGEMDMTTYATARRRMRRKIDKAFPDGWQQ